MIYVSSHILIHRNDHTGYIMYYHIYKYSASDDSFHGHGYTIYRYDPGSTWYQVVPVVEQRECVVSEIFNQS